MMNDYTGQTFRRPYSAIVDNEAPLDVFSLFELSSNQAWLKKRRGVHTSINFMDTDHLSFTSGTSNHPFVSHFYSSIFRVPFLIRPGVSSITLRFYYRVSSVYNDVEIDPGTAQVQVRLGLLQAGLYTVRSVSSPILLSQRRYTCSELTLDVDTKDLLSPRLDILTLEIRGDSIGGGQTINNSNISATWRYENRFLMSSATHFETSLLGPSYPELNMATETFTDPHFSSDTRIIVNHCHNDKPEAMYVWPPNSKFQDQGDTGLVQTQRMDCGYIQFRGIELQEESAPDLQRTYFHSGQGPRGEALAAEVAELNELAEVPDLVLLGSRDFQSSGAGTYWKERGWREAHPVAIGGSATTVLRASGMTHKKQPVFRFTALVIATHREDFEGELSALEKHKLIGRVEWKMTIRQFIPSGSALSSTVQYGFGSGIQVMDFWPLERTGKHHFLYTDWLKAIKSAGPLRVHREAHLDLGAGSGKDVPLIDVISGEVPVTLSVNSDLPFDFQLTLQNLSGSGYPQYKEEGDPSVALSVADLRLTLVGCAIWAYQAE